MENFTDVNAGSRSAALSRLQQLAEGRAKYNAAMMAKAEKRYNDYMEEMRRREEEARRAAHGSFLGDLFKGGIGGALMGGMASLMIPGVGPAAIGIGAAMGAASGGVGHLTGSSDFMFGQMMPMAMQGMTTYGIGQMMKAPVGGPGMIPGTNIPAQSGSTALVSPGVTLPTDPATGIAGPYVPSGYTPKSLDASVPIAREGAHPWTPMSAKSQTQTMKDVQLMRTYNRLYGTRYGGDPNIIPKTAAADLYESTYMNNPLFTDPDFVGPPELPEWLRGY